MRIIKPASCKVLVKIKLKDECERSSVIFDTIRDSVIYHSLGVRKGIWHDREYYTFQSANQGHHQQSHTDNFLMFSCPHK